MENKTIGGEQISPEIHCVVERLVGLLKPRTILLYNLRTSPSGDTSSFKLCVIAPMEDKVQAEKNAYLEIDCDIPFDLLLYTPEEWEEIVSRKSSFAQKIREMGTVLYG